MFITLTFIFVLVLLAAMATLGIVTGQQNLKNAAETRYSDTSLIVGTLAQACADTINKQFVDLGDAELRTLAYAMEFYSTADRKRWESNFAAVTRTMAASAQEFARHLVVVEGLAEGSPLPVRWVPLVRRMVDSVARRVTEMFPAPMKFHTWHYNVTGTPLVGVNTVVTVSTATNVESGGFVAPDKGTAQPVVDAETLRQRRRENMFRRRDGLFANVTAPGEHNSFGYLATTYVNVSVPVSGGSGTEVQQVAVSSVAGYMWMTSYLRSVAQDLREFMLTGKLDEYLLRHTWGHMAQLDEYDDAPPMTYDQMRRTNELWEAGIMNENNQSARVPAALRSVRRNESLPKTSSMSKYVAQLRNMSKRYHAMPGQFVRLAGQNLTHPGNITVTIEEERASNKTDPESGLTEFEADMMSMFVACGAFIRRLQARSAAEETAETTITWVEDGVTSNLLAERCTYRDGLETAAKLTLTEDVPPPARPDYYMQMILYRNGRSIVSPEVKTLLYDPPRAGQALFKTSEQVFSMIPTSRLVLFRMLDPNHLQYYIHQRVAEMISSVSKGLAQLGSEEMLLYTNYLEQDPVSGRIGASIQLASAVRHSNETAVGYVPPSAAATFAQRNSSAPPSGTNLTPTLNWTDDYRRLPVYAASVLLPTTDIGLVFEVDAEEITGPIAQVMNTFIYFILILTGAGLLTFFVVTWKLLKRMTEQWDIKAAHIMTQKAQVEGLLQSMVPAAVSARLLAGEKIIADPVAMLTFCFADISGFTARTRVMDAGMLVRFLGFTFMVMDTLAEHFGVYKVKTIGDCYFAIAGMGTSNALSVEEVKQQEGQLTMADAIADGEKGIGEAGKAVDVKEDEEVLKRFIEMSETASGVPEEDVGGMPEAGSSAPKELADVARIAMRLGTTVETVERIRHIASRVLMRNQATCMLWFASSVLQMFSRQFGRQRAFAAWCERVERKSTKVQRMMGAAVNAGEVSDVSTEESSMGASTLSTMAGGAGVVVAADADEDISAESRAAEATVEMRFGIATGPAVMGVLGAKTPAFDVWGPTVNLASRMESAASTNGIHVSSQTHQQVTMLQKRLVALAAVERAPFQFLHAPRTFVKGFGFLGTYHVRTVALDPPEMIWRRLGMRRFAAGFLHMLPGGTKGAVVEDGGTAADDAASQAATETGGNPAPDDGLLAMAATRPAAMARSRSTHSIFGKDGTAPVSLVPPQRGPEPPRPPRPASPLASTTAALGVLAHPRGTMEMEDIVDVSKDKLPGW